MSATRVRFWNKLMAVLIVVVVLIGALGITMSIRQSTAFTRDCHAKGGVVHDIGRDWLCLDSDGRVIRP